MSEWEREGFGLPFCSTICVNSINFDCSSDSSSCFRVKTTKSFSFSVVRVVHSFSSVCRLDFSSSN